MYKIPVYQPTLSGNEKTYVNACLDTGWISSRGSFVEKFESQFADFVGINHATSVCNGTVAIHLALEVLGIKPGDEVIVPTFTYIASVNAIVQAGAKPVFADSILETWQIDPADVARKVTPKTKAVMAVHLYGRPCEMDALVKICQAHGLLLIEDCAESFGTSDADGIATGTRGDIATYSFFGNKTITTGEGGMVTTNHKALHQLAAKLKSQGMSAERQYWHDMRGYNYRMTNIAAAIGLAQLERATEILEKKRQIAQWYCERLHNSPLVLDSELDTGGRHSFWMFSVLAEDAEQRNGLRSALRDAGVETRPFFCPAHLMPMYAAPEASFPVSEVLGDTGINLPSYPDLSEADIDYICEVMLTYYAQQTQNPQILVGTRAAMLASSPLKKIA